MNERETIASKAGLIDLALLKLHPADAPMDAVLADLRGRFGRHPTAFEQPTVNAMDMSRDDYRAAKATFLGNARNTGLQRDEAARAAATYARLARKHA